MKAVRVMQPEELKVIDVEKPVIDKQNNVLVKMKAAGICGSDVGIYHGTNAAATYPRIIGHEIVGVIEEVGENVKSLKPGDRVIVDQVVSCGECYACRKGRGNVCGSLKVRGVHIDGGYEEYLTRAELCEEDTLLILGYGALGSSILKIARLSGAKIIVADVIEEKLHEALKNGADYVINIAQEDVIEKVKELTAGYGVTVSIDAACVNDSLLTLLKATGNAGRVITMGFAVEPTEINQFLITSKELDVRGSRLQNKKFQEAIDLIQEGKLDLSGTVSHVYPIEKAQEAFDFVDSKDPSIRKVVLTFK